MALRFKNSSLFLKFAVTTGFSYRLSVDERQKRVKKLMLFKNENGLFTMSGNEWCFSALRVIKRTVARMQSYQLNKAM